MSKLEADIERLQSQLAALDQRLLDPGTYADGEAIKALQIERAHLERELEPLEAEWSRRAED